MDLTYWQMKELRQQLPKASLMTMEFANCYGDNMTEVRTLLCRNSKVLDILMQKDHIKQAGVLQLQMITESILLMAYERSNIPTLVQKVSHFPLTLFARA